MSQHAALHVKIIGQRIDDDGAAYGVEVCAACRDRWPCRGSQDEQIAALTQQVDHANDTAVDALAELAIANRDLAAARAERDAARADLAEMIQAYRKRDPEHVKNMRLIEEAADVILRKTEPGKLIAERDAALAQVERLRDALAAIHSGLMLQFPALIAQYRPIAQAGDADGMIDCPPEVLRALCAEQALAAATAAPGEQAGGEPPGIDQFGDYESLRAIHTEEGLFVHMGPDGWVEVAVVEDEAPAPDPRDEGSV